MHGDWLVWVHVEQRSANNLDHLLLASTVKRHLKVPDLDAEITTETKKIIKQINLKIPVLSKQ